MNDACSLLKLFSLAEKPLLLRTDNERSAENQGITPLTCNFASVPQYEAAKIPLYRHYVTHFPTKRNLPGGSARSNLVGTPYPPRGYKTLNNSQNHFHQQRQKRNRHCSGEDLGGIKEIDAIQNVETP